MAINLGNDAAGPAVEGSSLFLRRNTGADFWPLGHRCGHEWFAAPNQGYAAKTKDG